MVLVVGNPYFHCIQVAGSIILKDRCGQHDIAKIIFLMEIKIGLSWRICIRALESRAGFIISTLIKD